MHGLMIMWLHQFEEFQKCGLLVLISTSRNLKSTRFTQTHKSNLSVHLTVACQYSSIEVWCTPRKKGQKQTEGAASEKRVRRAHTGENQTQWQTLAFRSVLNRWENIPCIGRHSCALTHSSLRLCTPCILFTQEPCQFFFPRFVDLGFRIFLTGASTVLELDCVGMFFSLAMH